MTIKNPTQNIHAFITGVSSGIGRALAENMLEKGYRVSGIARREAALKTLAEKYDQFFGKTFRSSLMTKNHNFCYSFPLLSSLLKKGKNKRRMNSKIVILGHAVLLDQRILI